MAQSAEVMGNVSIIYLSFCDMATQRDPCTVILSKSYLFRNELPPKKVMLMVNR